jgi:hypothetical protein
MDNIRRKALEEICTKIGNIQTALDKMEIDETKKEAAENLSDAHWCLEDAVSLIKDVLR